MKGLPIHLVGSEEAWKASQQTRHGLFSRIAPRRIPAPSASRQLQDAALFVAGSLYERGYRLLRNGGCPLLVRNWSDWSAEILLRPHGSALRGEYVPVTADIHVTNHRLAETRSRYWRSSSRGVGHVGSVNIGTLICATACGATFNLAHPEAAPMLAMAVTDAGSLWIDRTTAPGSWDAHSPSPIDSQTTLELLLTYQGWGRAGRYLQSVLSEDEEMSNAVRAYYQRIERGQMACLIGDRLPRNLAVVASAYGLL